MIQLSTLTENPKNARAISGLVEAERQRVVVSKTETTIVGNAAAMREALELAIAIGDWCCAKTDDPLECCEYSCTYQVKPHGEAGADCPWNKIRAALSAPPRQCDVGTPGEQSERMEKDVCSKYHGCVRCPLRKAKYSDCSLGWAQTPYEAKEGDGK